MFTCRILPIAFAIVVVGSEHCLANSPYEGRLVGAVGRVVQVAKRLTEDNARANRWQTLRSPLTLRLNLHGRGSLRLRLSSFRRTDVESDIQADSSMPVVLFRGEATQRGSNRTRIATGSLYSVDGDLHLNLLFGSYPQGERAGRSYFIRASLPEKSTWSSSARVRSIPLVLLKSPQMCGVTAQKTRKSSPPQPLTARAAVQPVLMKTVRVTTIADHAYANRFRPATNAYIATVVDAASAIYESNLQIRLELAEQFVFSDPNSGPAVSSDITSTLDNVKDYDAVAGLNRTGHVTHLFSGLNFSGATVGLAYIGVVCAIPQFSYSVTQHFHPGADATLVAHEIGHNLGAEHDYSNGSSVMAASVSVPGSSLFSAFSIGQIIQHLFQSPQCLPETPVLPRGGGATQPAPMPVLPAPPPPALNDPFPGVRPPTVSVRASIRRKRKIKITSVVDGSWQGCFISVLGSERRDALESFQGVLLAGPTPQLQRRETLVRRFGERARGRIFIRAQYNCPSSSSAIWSNIVALSPSKLRGRVVSRSKWLKRLTRSSFRWLP